MMKNKVVFFSIFLFVIGMTISLAYSVKESYSAYVPKSNPLGIGVKNIDLLYFGKNLDFDTNYKTTINYIDSDGNITDNRYMDSFIMIPASSYKGESSGNNIWQMTSSDINSFIVREFNQLVALNNQVGYINEQRNSNIKVNVFLSIIIPSNNKTNSAINSFVDSSISAFNSGTYDVSNLNLVGFYWYHESVTSTADEDLMTSFNTYVHNKGYKTIWVPYASNYNAVAAGESHINDWHRYGYSKYNFDFVSIQSGYYFSGNDTVWMNFRNGTGRLPFTNNEASSYGMGVEFEAENNLYVSSSNCNRLKDFLAYAVRSDAGWNSGINVYYMPGFLSDIEGTRITYELIYKYAKNTLTSSDVNSFSCTKTYYSKFQNVSKNKSYSVVPFINSNGGAASSSYLDDGVKLTDGKYGQSAYGDEWVGFIRTISSNLKYIDIDLSKVESSLSYFYLELEKDEGAGIKLPVNPINVYVSNTSGSNYTYVGSLAKTNNSSVFKSLVDYQLNLGNDGVSGRYVRFAWETNYSTEPFVFVSEAVVGKTSTISFNRNESNISYGKTKSFSAYISNGTASNLSVSTDNANVATATIDPDGMVDISAVGVGTANIIVTDTRYGNSKKHSVVVSKDLESISISTLPDTYYFKNEVSMNLTGGKLELLYSDNSKEYINLSHEGVNISGFDSTKTGKNTITVNYNNKTTTFDINIVPKIIISTLASDTSLQLPGSSYTIYNSKCNDINNEVWKESFVSGENPYETKLNISNNNKYDYCLVQNEVANDYILNNNKINFSVQNKQLLNSVEFINNPIFENGEFIKFGDLNVIRNYILLDNTIEISYGEFVNNIIIKNGYSYKIYMDNNEVSDGNIYGGMILKTYRGNEELESYNITYDYVEFREDIIIDDDNKVIDKIIPKTTVANLISSISTNGSISIFDSENNTINDNNKKLGTGYKVKIEGNDQVYEYLISVKGDTTGDGNINVSDIVDVANTIVNDRNLAKVYYSASDYNEDSSINVKDIVSIARYIVDGE